jgi:DNA-binding XRE family transcriptional regulator
VSAIVTDLREKLNFTKTEMAHELRVTLGALYNYEHSKRLPAIRIAYRIIELAKSHGIAMTLEDIYPDR